LIVAIKLRDPKAPLTLENLELDQPNAIQLDLDGQAIRDLQYDEHLKAFLIISGAPEFEERADFVLWRWDGDRPESGKAIKPTREAVLESKMKPEGITPMNVSNHAFVFIVGDASKYAKIEYVSP